VIPRLSKGGTCYLSLDNSSLNKGDRKPPAQPGGKSVSLHQSELRKGSMRSTVGDTLRKASGPRGGRLFAERRLVGVGGKSTVPANPLWEGPLHPLEHREGIPAA